jgi:hypothetical protein
MLISTLLAAAVLVGSDPDGVVATAPAASEAVAMAGAPSAPSVEGAARQAATHGLTTDQQIERWVAAREPAPAPWAEAGPQDDGELHGEFSVTVGTGGYRDYAAAVSAPLGDHGRLDISYRQVENGYRPYGYDLYFDDSGYVFPGMPHPDEALDFEVRAARPGGPPLRTSPALEQRRDW